MARISTPNSYATNGTPVRAWRRKKRLPKNKRYISERATCPYYRSQERQKIYCEGVERDTAIVLTFSYPGDRVAYEEHYCEGKHSECKIYRTKGDADELYN